MTKCGVSLLSGIVCVCVLAGCPAADPQLIRVVFRTTPSPGGTSGLYAVDLDGGNLVRVTEAEEHPYVGHVTPDGRQIVYMAAKPSAAPKLVVANLDGSGRRPLTEGAGLSYCDAVTADGSRAVFHMTGDGTSRLMTIRLDGTGLTDLTESLPGTIMYNIVARPATSQLAMTVISGGNHEIYAVDAAGGPAINLTSNSAYDYGYAYSRDGTKMLFCSDRDGSDDLYAMNADGTGVTRLTHGLDEDFAAAFSPDGSKVLYQAGLPHEGSWGATRALHVVNTDGTGDVLLAKPVRVVPDHAWSPDGRRVVFALLEGGAANIHVKDADGTDLTQITSTGYDSAPTWSPDGRKIIFASNREGQGYRLFRMNPDGTEQTRLTSGTDTEIFQGSVQVP